MATDKRTGAAGRKAQELKRRARNQATAAGDVISRPERPAAAAPVATGTRLIPLPQLARMWAWDQQKIYRLVNSKAIPHVRINGRVYFEESTIAAWLESKRVQPTEDPNEAARSRLAQGQRTREEEMAILGLTVDNHPFL